VYYTDDNGNTVEYVSTDNLGLTKQEPQFAKFNYTEKMEYWTFLWGTTVMALSGFLLWFNNFTLRRFPKWITDAATAVHWYEALLATFSILIWHFHLVIFDPMVYPMDTAWLDGNNSGGSLSPHAAGLLSRIVAQRVGARN
jgi:cytochrome b subunit of formate dehydrogenase